jgi:hypothetical protein
LIHPLSHSHFVCPPIHFLMPPSCPNLLPCSWLFLLVVSCFFRGARLTCPPPPPPFFFPTPSSPHFNPKQVACPAHS